MRRYVVGVLLAALLCGLFVPTLADEAVCATADEYLSALMEAGASAEKGQFVSFEVPVTEELLDELSADDDALLHELELNAGLAEVHYAATGKSIRYRNSVFDDMQYADDIASLVDALNAGPLETYRNIYVQCSDELYEYLTDDIWLDLRRLLNDCCGMVDVDYTTGLLPVICFTPRRYYSSYVMIEALRSGDTSALSDDERAALDIAQQWASQVTPGDDESVMRQIHDIICANVEYDYDKTPDFCHSCVGALLHGTCVCDGYADTFMLLGTMCGLDVTIQIGGVPSGEELLVEMGNHAWNMVRVDGEWRMVDVTWDDGSGSYDYFNLSRSQAPDTHEWVWGPEGWN